MKRPALLLASTAMLLAGPVAAETNAPLHHLRSSAPESGILLAQQEGEMPADEPQAEKLLKRQEKQAERARRAAEQGAEQQLKEQRAAERNAKRQADRAAEQAAREQRQIEEKARRQADREAARQAEQDQRRAQDEKAKRITEEEQRKTQMDLERRAERAKKQTDTEIRQTEKVQEKAAEQAKRKTRAAQREAEKEAEKAAEQAKRQADRAVKRQEQETATPTPKPERNAEKVTPAQKRPATSEPTPQRRALEKRRAPLEEEAVPPAPSEQAEQPPARREAAPQPDNAAPALDSAKEAAPAAPQEGKPLRRLQRQPEGTRQAAPAPAPAEQPDQAEPLAAPPKNDAAAQQLEIPERIESVRAEEGRRVDRAPRWERPRDVQVLQKFDDRTVVEVNNNIYVESPDRPRLSRDAREVYYEDLPHQRVRETIVRPNGVQIVTIRNRYGDVIQRSRITPDGDEILLNYTPDDERERLLAWRDPGEDLPPLRLTIPEDEYIFDDPDAPEDEVYAFLSQPPVERVERTYSIDEVKRSARLRDKLRRIDLDTITFGFGSAEIAEDQITRMENVANAMLEILKKNPAETFLIEGHTDAVGSDRANLVLSDRRAEAVAEALTNVFEIPPENMATQGYGERYLKINTQGPEQENRRVAIRRITPLVAPVASR